jgi:hypothetical protein
MQRPRRHLLSSTDLAAQHNGAKVWPNALNLHSQTRHRGARSHHLKLIFPHAAYKRDAALLRRIDVVRI